MCISTERGPRSPVNSPLAMPTFKYTGLDSPITKFAIMLVGRRDNHYSVVGSGVLIGPGAAITANHVIRELHDIFDDEKAERDGNNITTQFTLQAIHFPRRRKSVAWAWDVRQVFHDDQPDLAFLKLHPTHEEQLSYKWHSPRLQLLPPTCWCRSICLWLPFFSYGN